MNRTLRQWRDLISPLPTAATVRRRPPRPKREPGPPPIPWTVTLPPPRCTTLPVHPDASGCHTTVIVTAPTKSEARALVKDRLEVDRLPPDTAVTAGLRATAGAA